MTSLVSGLRTDPGLRGLVSRLALWLSLPLGKPCLGLKSRRTLPPTRDTGHRTRHGRPPHSPLRSAPLVCACPMRHDHTYTRSPQCAALAASSILCTGTRLSSRESRQILHIRRPLVPSCIEVLGPSTAAVDCRSAAPKAVPLESVSGRGTPTLCLSDAAHATPWCASEHALGGGDRSNKSIEQATSPAERPL